MSDVRMGAGVREAGRKLVGGSGLENSPTPLGGPRPQHQVPQSRDTTDTCTFERQCLLRIQ